MVEEGREDHLTPLPLGKVRVCCWIIEVSAEHGFCTRMEVIGEHQRWGTKVGDGKQSKTLPICHSLNRKTAFSHHETIK